VELAPDLPLLRCDAGQIEQVVVSLITNAIDAMPSSGSLWIRTRHPAGSPDVQIQVQDNGVGIAPELLPNLFEPFFTTKERGHGLGLGLAISRNIVERHQGRIEVTSQPGQGSQFTISLPLSGIGASAESPRAAA
jgi:signal transduction histidine kinase